MTDREKYSQFARLLFDEIGARAMLEDETAIASNHEFVAEIAGLRSIINEDTAPDTSVLSSAFGLVELFVHSKWEALISEAYSDFQKMQLPKSDR